jgi:dienelactone hydrolase/predicted negative regulator of RcsB-dependent stress response
MRSISAIRVLLLEVVAAVCFVFASIVASTAVAQQVPVFQFMEKPGSHAVGLEVMEQYDFSRTYRQATDDLGKPYTKERARPLQTLIWYPAEKSAGKPMTVADYIDLFATETSFGEPHKGGSVESLRGEMAPSLGSVLWAVRDAKLASGRFPVVIYAPSFSAKASENADLCEYLASHGYVVIASPDMGETTRSMTEDLVGTSAQARDISFLIGYAQTLPNTDMSEVAVVGFSWGGLSNVVAAARDNRIDALVSLDGSARYSSKLVKEAGDVHPEQMTLPWLFFTQGDLSLEEVERSHFLKSIFDAPNVLNAWTHGDLVTVHMLGMTHQEFSSMFQRNEQIWKSSFPEYQRADYEREDGYTGYTWVVRYTLQFLNAYLKHDAAAMAYLKRKPTENGSPKHFMSVDFRAAKGVPISLEAFRAALGQRGFDHASEIYVEMQKEKSDFKLNEEAMNSWAYRLMDENHLPEATELLKMNVQIYPESSNVYDSLGEAYMKAGQKELAIKNYKKSLELDPNNSNAVEMLKKLEGGPAAPK